MIKLCNTFNYFIVPKKSFFFLLSFVFIYITMSKDLSLKFYQRNKEILPKKDIKVILEKKMYQKLNQKKCIRSWKTNTGWV